MQKLEMTFSIISFEPAKQEEATKYCGVDRIVQDRV